MCAVDALDWLKTNFYKTELELGHCLRLPQEGPCECDLYLTCAKFVTTAQYAPRLRERLCLERQRATTPGSEAGSAKSTATSASPSASTDCWPNSASPMENRDAGSHREW